MRNGDWGIGELENGEWGLGNGGGKETSQQNRSVLGSIPRYIKSPPGGNGDWGLGNWGIGDWGLGIGDWGIGGG